MKTTRLLSVLVLLASAGVLFHAWQLRQAPVASAAAHQLKYQCPMHPQIVRDEPGDCPICHMHLQLVQQDSPSTGSGRASVAAPGHGIVKWRNPMNPAVFSDHAQKDEMGMDYIPVYADEIAATGAVDAVPGHAPFVLSEERRQLIGVRSEAAQVRTVTRTLRLPGRVGENPGTILAQALEMDGSVLKRGLDAQVWVTGEGARKAKVASVDRSLDAFSRTFGVRLALQEASGPGFRPGVYCDVRVELELGQGVTVPKEAVLDTGDHAVVVVQKDGGRFEPRDVEMGKEGDDYVEIRKGVAVGEQVVTSA
ncbi:MAG TPA: heavy metal-binding domain-containing protein, partial [bacterium]|nr:heavy metal-binding domain-containing protein [bacterium]